jgi:hypothetical protein
MDEPPETYSLIQVAALFRTDRRSIRLRLERGDFDYTVNELGHYKITRESVLRHLEELQVRNNRID